MKAFSRRSFLQHGAWGSLAAGAAGPPLRTGHLFAAAQGISQQQLISPQRMAASGRFVLELNGATAGWVLSASGGQYVSSANPPSSGGTVVTNKIGVAAKQIPALPTLTNLVLQTGVGMSRAFYQWLAASLMAAVPGNLTILSCDFNYKVQTQTDYQNGVITQALFPALDK